MSLRPESENVFGLVVGRVLENVGDGGDEDSLPDYLPAPPGARVVFTPLQALVTTTGPTAFLRRSPVTCPLDKETGEILSSREPRQVGVWLAQGVWRVTFYTGDGAEIPSFTFEVTGAHTVFAPLDLVTVAPYSPPPGGSTVVVELPGGAASGMLLGWSEAGLAWVEQTGGDYATRAELPDVSGLATTAYVDQMVGDIDTVLSGILEGE